MFTSASADGATCTDACKKPRPIEGAQAHTFRHNKSTQFPNNASRPQYIPRVFPQASGPLAPLYAPRAGTITTNYDALFATGSPLYSHNIYIPPLIHPYFSSPFTVTVALPTSLQCTFDSCDTFIFHLSLLLFLLYPSVFGSTYCAEASGARRAAFRDAGAAERTTQHSRPLLGLRSRPVN
jgi:hypothetical protein